MRGEKRYPHPRGACGGYFTAPNPRLNGWKGYLRIAAKKGENDREMNEIKITLYNDFE